MERTQVIKQKFEGVGTLPDILYSNQEIVDHLKELEALLAKGIFEKTHAENLRDRDVMIHFDALAKEYNLEDNNTYLRFKKNMSELSYTVGSFIKGMNGEKIARRALKLISLDTNVRVLYNVQLADEDCQTEYDAIVVTPYGLFVVEVKNWGYSMNLSSMGLLTRKDEASVVYDLPGRMSIKEALLREILADNFPEQYNNILLLSNEKASIEDNYHQIPICCGGGISYAIRSYSRCSKESLTEEQVDEIANLILSAHKEQKAPCTVKCQEIIDDYAELMVLIENASSKTNEFIEDSPKIRENNAQAEEPQDSPWYMKHGWKIALGSVAVVAPIIITLVSKKD